MKIQAGELDQRGTFTRRVDKKDAYGDLDSTSYENVGTYWVKLTLVSNANKEVAKGFSPNAAWQLLMYYRPQIDNQCKVEIRGKEYLVSGVIHDPTPEKDWTQCFLSSVEK